MAHSISRTFSHLLVFFFRFAVHKYFYFKTCACHFFISHALSIFFHVQVAAASHFFTRGCIDHGVSHSSTIFSDLLFLHLWMNINAIKPKVSGLICICFAVFLAQRPKCGFFIIPLASNFQCSTMASNRLAATY
jgi:hypothetical protein